MKIRRFHLAFLLTAIFSLTFSNYANAQDESKRATELPLENLMQATSKELSLAEVAAINPARFLSKAIIETPIENVLAGSAKPSLSRAKNDIEFPTETLLTPPTSPSTNGASTLSLLAAELVKSVDRPVIPKSFDDFRYVQHSQKRHGKTTSENPPVKPGDVNWHANFEAACARSKLSGKPVLLFQLMGQLDQQFT